MEDEIQRMFEDEDEDEDEDGENIEPQEIDPSRTNTTPKKHSNRVIYLVMQKGANINRLKRMVKKPDADVNFTNNEDRKTALHWAAQNGNELAVDLLLEAGADIKRDSEGNTALHYAVKSESFAVFKRLLPSQEKLATKCYSDYKFEYLTTKRGSIYARTKIDSDIDMVTSVNNEGSNVLDLALEKLTYMKKDIVRYIVRETDLNCLLRLLRNNSKRNFSSPFRGLIKEMPELAKEVMDKCITRKENSIDFHYEFLDDTYFLNSWKPDYTKTGEHSEQKDIETREAYTKNICKLKNNHPLKLMIKGKRKETTKNGIYQQLLDHPLVKYLVMRKWNHIGWKVHILDSLLYLVYLLTLSVCVSTTVPPYVHSQNTTACQNVTSIGHDTTTCLNKTTEGDPVTCQSFESNRKSIILDHIVITLSFIMLSKEVYKLVKMYRCEYFKQIENYIGLVVYILSLWFVLDVTEFEVTDYRTNWQRTCGTISVFVAWMYLLAFAKRFDRLGVYILMLLSIGITFLWTVFPIVAVLLIATALAFTYTHQDQVNFGSFFTTTRMIIIGSEFEEFLNSGDDYYSTIPSFIIYAIIQYLMAILVINLMVAVAVEKVKKLHKDARDMNTVFQIEYSLEFEGMMCKMFKERFIFKPNEEIKLTQLKSKRLPVQQIMDLINKNKAENEQDRMLGRMNQIEMKMTKILDTIETKLNRLNSTTTTNERMNTAETK